MGSTVRGCLDMLTVVRNHANIYVVWKCGDGAQTQHLLSTKALAGCFYASIALISVPKPCKWTQLRLVDDAHVLDPAAVSLRTRQEMAPAASKEPSPEPVQNEGGEEENEELPVTPDVYDEDQGYSLTPLPGWKCSSCEMQNSDHVTGTDSAGNPKCGFCPHVKCDECKETTE